MMLCVEENSCTNETTHPVSTTAVQIGQSHSLVTSQLPTRERAGKCKINTLFVTFTIKSKLDEKTMPPPSQPTRPHSTAPTIKKEVTVRLLLAVNYIH